MISETNISMVTTNFQACLNPATDQKFYNMLKTQNNPINCKLTSARSEKKLRAGYRAPSIQCTSYFSSSSEASCASSSCLGYLCTKFRFCHPVIAELARVEKLSRTQSLTQLIWCAGNWSSGFGTIVISSCDWNIKLQTKTQTGQYRVSFSQLDDLYAKTEAPQLYVEGFGHVGRLPVDVGGAAEFPELRDDAAFTMNHFILGWCGLIQPSVDECNHCITIEISSLHCGSKKRHWCCTL